MNMRCHWEPGCPAWMHPGHIVENANKQEQTALAAVWLELFPTDAIPEVLAQPCCAQFAVSRDRIQSLSKGQYIFYRDWLLSTELSDYISGRVWEYLWHYLFTGRNVYCPKEHVCYCDGFGVCFGGEDEYEAWWKKMWEKRLLEEQLKEWHGKNDEYAVVKEFGKEKEIKDIPLEGLGEELRLKIAELDGWLTVKLKNAKERGNIPANRAKEADVEP